MNIQLLLRTVFIIITSIGIHSILHKLKLPYSMKFMESSLFFPVLMSFIPYLMSKLPLLGISDLAKDGVPPIFAMLILASSGYASMMIVQQLKSNNSKDALHKFLNKNIKLGVLEIKPEFMMCVLIASFFELLIQQLYTYNLKNEKLNEIVRGIEKFVKKHDINMTKLKIK